MFCKDDSITYLNHLGYNVILTPREGLAPGLVLAGVKTALDRLGPLSDFVQGSPPLPFVQGNLQAPNVTQKTSNKLGLDLGVNLLDRLLKAMNACDGKIGAHYAKAANIELIFEDVLLDTMDPSALGKYLGSTLPDTVNPWMAHLDGPGKAYVVTEIIKSDKFGVVAYGENSETLELDTQAIQQMLGGNAKVTQSGSRTRELVYQGPKHLVFGFRAVEFWIDTKNQPPAFHLNLTGSILVAKGIAAPQASPLTIAIFGKNQLLELDGI
jgi:hypothetical protein